MYQVIAIRIIQVLAAVSGILHLPEDLLLQVVLLPVVLLLLPVDLLQAAQVQIVVQQILVLLALVQTEELIKNIIVQMDSVF